MILILREVWEDTSLSSEACVNLASTLTSSLTIEILVKESTSKRKQSASQLRFTPSSCFLVNTGKMVVFLTNQIFFIICLFL